MRTEFQPDQQVIHPNHGAGRVAGWHEEEIAGETRRFLVVAFPRTTLTLRIPAAKIADSGLREPASHAEMASALDVLPEPSLVTLDGSWPRSAPEYGRKLNSGEPRQVAEVLRDLNQPGRRPQVSAVYREALTRLAEELALVEAIDIAAAEARIEALLPPVH